MKYVLKINKPNRRTRRSDKIKKHTQLQELSSFHSAAKEQEPEKTEMKNGSQVGIEYNRRKRTKLFSKAGITFEHSVEKLISIFRTKLSC